MPSLATVAAARGRPNLQESGLTARPLRILLIDDHAVVREGVRALLEDEPGLQVVGEFGDADSAIAAVARLEPDVAILDLRLPGPGPVATIRAIKQAWSATQILIFTSFAPDAQIRDILDAGALGYLLKDALRDDLLRAVRCVAEGEAWLHPAAQRQLVEMLRRPALETEPLTPREKSVLKLIAEGKSNKEIGRALALTEGTVKGYVSQILQKLALADRTQAALYAVRSGMLDAG
jgi:DNA-binding NarL/FixJ family response regulator